MWNVVTILLSAGVSILVSLYIYSRKQVFTVKKEALLNTLAFLDDYLSCLEYFVDGKPLQARPIRRKNADKEELTFRARDCYNKLCVTCDSADVVEAFLDIVVPRKNGTDVGKRVSVMEKYNRFRRCVRNELGLKDVNLDEDRTFLVVVGSESLK